MVAKCRLGMPAAMLDFHMWKNQPADAMFFQLKLVLGIAKTLVNCRNGDHGRLHAFINIMDDYS